MEGQEYLNEIRILLGRGEKSSIAQAATTVSCMCKATAGSQARVYGRAYTHKSKRIKPDVCAHNPLSPRPRLQLKRKLFLMSCILTLYKIMMSRLNDLNFAALNTEK